MTLLQYRLSCIDQYVQAGFALFPTKNKIPLIKGWQLLQPSTSVSHDYLGIAYGVVLTATDVVIDFDPRRGENQLTDFIKALQLETPINTFIVRTASGGLHIYFKKPKDMRIPKRLNMYNAIDLQSAGRYVIGAGSTVNNTTYRIVRQSPSQIAELSSINVRNPVPNVS